MKTCRKRTGEKEGEKDTWVEQEGGGGVFFFAEWAV